MSKPTFRELEDQFDWILHLYRNHRGMEIKYLYGSSDVALGNLERDKLELNMQVFKFREMLREVTNE